MTQSHPAVVGIETLAAHYNLEEGIDQDFYFLQRRGGKRTPCLTKRGSAKVIAAEGIIFDMPVVDFLPHGIAYRSTFRMRREGVEVTALAVGSARYDGNNAEGTHTPEMAWKRMVVRGVLTLVAPADTIYGEDEMPADILEDGRRNARSASSGDGNGGGSGHQAPTSRQSPATAPAVDGELSEAVTSAAGWFRGAERLPADWSGVVEQISAEVHLPAKEFARLLFDHCGKFRGAEGWLAPSTKYSSFKAFAFGVQSNGRSRAPVALSTVKNAKAVLEALKERGHAYLEVPDPNNATALIRALTLQSVNQQVPATPAAPSRGASADYLDDVPF